MYPNLLTDTSTMTMIFTFIFINSLGDPDCLPKIKRAKKLYVEIERAYFFAYTLVRRVRTLSQIEKNREEFSISFWIIDLLFRDLRFGFPFLRFIFPTILEY